MSFRNRAVSTSSLPLAVNATVRFVAFHPRTRRRESLLRTGAPFGADGRPRAQRWRGKALLQARTWLAPAAADGRGPQPAPSTRPPKEGPVSQLPGRNTEAVRCAEPFLLISPLPGNWGERKTPGRLAEERCGRGVEIDTLLRLLCPRLAAPLPSLAILWPLGISGARLCLVFLNGCTLATLGVVY